LNLHKLQITISIIAILSGLSYVLQVYGPTEKEVVNWGYIAIFFAIITLVLALMKKKNMLATNIFIILLTVIQMPAVFLWFIFSGTSISDGSPQSDFVASWVFAIPHIVIVLLGFMYITISIKQALNQ
jgi:heme/copper-type cytochrome/quinol oxidase subunit 4